MTSTWFVAAIGYGAALTFACGTVMGFVGCIITKSGSQAEQQAAIWWVSCAVLALAFAAVTHALVGGAA